MGYNVRLFCVCVEEYECVFLCVLDDDAMLRHYPVFTCINYLDVISCYELMLINHNVFGCEYALIECMCVEDSTWGIRAATNTAPKCAAPKIKGFAFKRIQINNDNDD